MVTLNRAVAVAMVHGPQAGLDLLATLDADDRMADHHRLAAVRAHCWKRPATGRRGRRVPRRRPRATSIPEQRYLGPAPPNWPPPRLVTQAPEPGPVRQAPEQGPGRQAPERGA